MMNVSVICVGKLKESYLRDGCAEYVKRLSAYCKINVVEVAEERASDNPKKTEIAQILQKEGERIIAKIPKGSAVVPLCIEGREYSSPDFSALIEKISLDYSSSASITSISKIRGPFAKPLFLPKAASIPRQIPSISCGSNWLSTSKTQL